MSKVGQYMETVQAVRCELSRLAQVTTSLIDGLGESIADQSKAMYDYFSSSFEHFAGLVEILETSLYNLKLQAQFRLLRIALLLRRGCSSPNADGALSSSVRTRPSK
ncbi:unnamed protein product [Effrenium voratum]|nr:unnamed protein product [Effrenium voratum]